MNLHRNSLIVALLLLPGWLQANLATGGNYILTKCLVGESGVNQAASVDYGTPYALGEDASGVVMQSADYNLATGYFSGYPSGAVGPFSLVSATVGTSKVLQDGFQVGVPLNATVQLVFSSPLDPTTLSAGLQVLMVMDHMGQPSDTVVASSYTYVVTGSSVIIAPQGAWPGNSLLDVVVNSQLQSIDGFALAQAAHTQFITVLDPSQENIVLHPIPIPSVAAAPGLTSAPSLNLDIPSGSLSNFAYVLVSQDPLHSPLQANPQILQAATQKAQGSGGAYETPLAYEEIAAYNEQGQPMSLAKSITFTITSTGGQGLSTTTGAPIRPETLSLWTLDAAHSLWVKLPDSRPDGAGVAGAVTQFSVYALMGSADSDASNVFVFPTPWRPHGPNAGDGPGQTGTESGGITFSNLPSECTIKIYTISGKLVRQIQHSDLAGPVAQQVWDGNTSGGEHAASGVYLWRVESSADSKNGKLIVIR
jgi:flagellar hook capping protein FlgD/Big-like domain-containing protein